ncbi:MAG: RDD family protein [Flavobacterium sp.]|nr:MAG: RDD family protein [Flavobacterium sp.]
MKTKPNILKRALSTIIDYTILFSLFYFVVISFGTPNADSGGYSMRLPEGLLIFLIWPIYIVVFEKIYGATLGHKLFNLEVISLDGSEISTLQVIKRRLCDPIDILWILGLFAFIMVKNTQYNQRLGDIWAKTIVIDKTDPDQASLKNCSKLC